MGLFHSLLFNLAAAAAAAWPRPHLLTCLHFFFAFCCGCCCVCHCRCPSLSTVPLLYTNYGALCFACCCSCFYSCCCFKLLWHSLLRRAFHSFVVFIRIHIYSVNVINIDFNLLLPRSKLISVLAHKLIIAPRPCNTLRKVKIELCRGGVGGLVWCLGSYIRLHLWPNLVASLLVAGNSINI